MADAFVTLVSIQPAVSGVSAKGAPAQNRPQAQRPRAIGGIYAARRKRLVLRSKPNGAK